MSKNIDQVFIANPITSNAATDLMYFGQSPYGITNDAAMTYANFAAQFSSKTLTNAHIFVGNASNVATDVAMSGDATIANTGAVTLANTAVTPAAYTVNGQALFTVDSKGRITAASNATISGTFIYNDVSGTTQAAAVNNGYIISNASQTTVTLPATAAEGSVIAVQGKGAAGWILTANTGQVIHLGNTASSSAGSLTSTNLWDAVEVVCVTANTTWAVKSVIGNLTVT